MQATLKTKRITYVAMFSAIAAVLMYLEFPLPFMPPFLKVDLSGIAVLLAAFMLGPMETVAVALLKDLVHLLSTQTGGVGELADFLMLTSLALTAHYIYRANKTKRGALLSCVAGSGVMVVVAALSNYFLLIPFYSKLMPIDAIIAACAAVNPAIDSLGAYILFGVLPFNIIKCFLISFVTMLSYKKLSQVLRLNMPL